ncbi:DUF6350 family protein [Corynebacterium pilosum]|uniref:cell division protein PerM n=1 Tax=Corynebacterium pilosum TaxID=35756 RepID=UPI003B003260
MSLLYLPNAIVGTLAVLFGGQVSIGAASVSLFAIDLVPLPVFPLFAAIPGTAAAWAPVLLLIPFAVVVHYAITRAWDGPMVAATAVFAGMWRWSRPTLSRGSSAATATVVRSTGSLPCWRPHGSA